MDSGPQVWGRLEPDGSLLRSKRRGRPSPGSAFLHSPVPAVSTPETEERKTTRCFLRMRDGAASSYVCTSSKDAYGEAPTEGLDCDDTICATSEHGSGMTWHRASLHSARSPRPTHPKAPPPPPPSTKGPAGQVGCQAGEDTATPRPALPGKPGPLPTRVGEVTAGAPQASPLPSPAGGPRSGLQRHRGDKEHPPEKVQEGPRTWAWPWTPAQAAPAQSLAGGGVGGVLELSVPFAFSGEMGVFQVGRGTARTA